MSVIYQWIGHSPVVHEVVSLPLAGGQDFFGALEHTCVTQDLCCHFQRKYLCQVNTNVCLPYMTKVLCSWEHKLVCGQHKCFKSLYPRTSAHIFKSWKSVMFWALWVLFLIAVFLSHSLVWNIIGSNIQYMEYE